MLYRVIFIDYEERILTQEELDNLPSYEEDDILRIEEILEDN